MVQFIISSFISTTYFSFLFLMCLISSSIVGNRSLRQKLPEKPREPDIALLNDAPPQILMRHAIKTG